MASVFTDYKRLIILTVLFLSNGFMHALEKVATEVLDPMHDNSVSGYFIKLDKGELFYGQEMDNLIEKLLACPTALRLVNKVLQDGSIIILYSDESEAPAGGLWSPQFRLVKINHNEPETRQLGHLLYELADALQYKNQLAFGEAVKAGVVGREKYTENWERVQYETAKEFVAAVDQCILLNKWPQATSMKIEYLFMGGKDAIGSSFESFWLYIKEQPHADFFRKDWDRLIKNIYCRSNPKAADCVGTDFWDSLKKLIS